VATITPTGNKRTLQDMPQSFSTIANAIESRTRALRFSAWLCDVLGRRCEMRLGSTSTCGFMNHRGVVDLDGVFELDEGIL